METQTSRTDLCVTRGSGEGGGGGLYGESNMETYITIYKIDSQQEFSVWLKELQPGLCNDLEGWD